MLFPSDLTNFHSLIHQDVFTLPTNYGYIQNNGFVNNNSSVSNNSTSDEADGGIQLSITNERKQRRMLSNRESARRSRMRKQKHLDELWSQAVRLKTENHTLIDKLNSICETHEKVLEENKHLKQETSDLRRMLTDLQLANTFTSLQDLDENPCTAAHLMAGPSHQPTTTYPLH